MILEFVGFFKVNFFYFPIPDSDLSIAQRPPGCRHPSGSFENEGNWCKCKKLKTDQKPVNDILPCRLYGRPLLLANEAPGGDGGGRGEAGGGRLRWVFFENFHKFD